MILRFSLAIVACAALFVFTPPTAAQGQEAASNQTSAQATTASAQKGPGEAKTVEETASVARETRPSIAPVFKEYRGVEIGMTADNVRGKLKDYLRSKNETEDFYLFSGGEAATVYYDAEGKVTAISADFPAKSVKAPSAKEVLGLDAAPKTDGSVYSLVRYPEAGYWVAYSRTSGDSPLVTITIQKMR